MLGRAGEIQLFHFGEIIQNRISIFGYFIQCMAWVLTSYAEKEQFVQFWA